MKLFLIALAAALVACQQSAPTIESSPDPYSEQCAQGLYGTASGACAPLHSCSQDSDCSYLLIEQTFPRYGRCVEGMCKAYCGSGIERECTRT